MLPFGPGGVSTTRLKQRLGTIRWALASVFEGAGLRCHTSDLIAVLLLLASWPRRAPGLSPERRKQLSGDWEPAGEEPAPSPSRGLELARAEISMMTLELALQQQQLAQEEEEEAAAEEEEPQRSSLSPSPSGRPAGSRRNTWPASG